MATYVLDDRISCPTSFNRLRENLKILVEDSVAPDAACPITTAASNSKIVAVSGGALRFSQLVVLSISTCVLNGCSRRYADICRLSMSGSRPSAAAQALLRTRVPICVDGSPPHQFDAVRPSAWLEIGAVSFTLREILNRRLLRSLPHHMPHRFVLIDDVIATVDVNRVACYQLGAVEREEGNRLTDVVNADEAPRWRLALCF